MQPGTSEAFWNLTASVFLQEESCINALNKDPPPPLPLSAPLCDKQGVYVVIETHHSVMELKYIYCVPCHNLLLNKLTVLEKPPVIDLRCR